MIEGVRTFDLGTIDGETYHEQAADQRERDIHSGDVAAAHGFRGAVVQGIRVLEAALAPMLAELGEAWFAGGRVALRHRRPVYDDMPLTAEFVPTQRPGSFDLSVRDADGDQVAVGEFDIPDSAVRRQDPPTPPAGPPVTEKFRAEPGRIPFGYAVVGAPMPVDDELLRSAGLRRTDFERGERILSAALAVQAAGRAGIDEFEYLTPAMHYAADATFSRAPRFASDLHSSGIVTEVFERNGHHYFTTDYVVAGSEGVVAVVRQTVLYHMRGGGA